MPWNDHKEREDADAGARRVVSRHRVAATVHEALLREFARAGLGGAVAVHDPDDAASVGLDFGDLGYVLLHVEVAREGPES